MARDAGSDLRLIRQASLALACAIALLVALSLLVSWLTPLQVFPPPVDWAQPDAGAATAAPNGLWRLVHGWTTFEPWDGTSVNVHWGSLSRTFSGSPVVALAFIAVLAILFYVVRCRSGRLGSGFDWRVAAAIFLACWIVLDALWQVRLLRQLSDTHSTYAGKSYEEKVRASHDGLLVHFAEAVQEVVPGQRGRILVGSESDYFGMRGAYFLYPHNVLWQRYGPEIPPRQFLRSGDYIALFLPTTVQMNVAASMIAVPGAAPIEVEPVFEHPAGYLFRVR
jgi:hypothetical protein